METNLTWKTACETYAIQRNIKKNKMQCLYSFLRRRKYKRDDDNMFIIPEKQFIGDMARAKKASAPHDFPETTKGKGSHHKTPIIITQSIDTKQSSIITVNVKFTGMIKDVITRTHLETAQSYSEIVQRVVSHAILDKISKLTLV